jgi:hypothetical protein
MQHPQAAVASPKGTAQAAAQAAALQKHRKTQAQAPHTQQGLAARSSRRAMQPKRRAFDSVLRLRLTAKAKAKARA